LGDTNIGTFDLSATFLELMSNSVHSPDFEKGVGGFSIYTDAVGHKIIEADTFVERNPSEADKNKIIDISGTDDFYVTQFSNIIDAMLQEDEPSENSTKDLILTVDKNIFAQGDAARIVYRRPVVVYP
jgi:hypothetical protein